MTLNSYRCNSIEDLNWASPMTPRSRGCLKYDVKIHGVPAIAMFDLGCDLPMGCVSEEFVKKHGLVSTIGDATTVQVANGVYVECTRVLKNITVKFLSENSDPNDSGRKVFKQRLDIPVLPIEIDGVDIVLSINWGRSWDANICLKTDSVKLQRRTPSGRLFSTQLRSRAYHAAHRDSLMSLSRTDIRSSSDVLSPKKFAKEVVKQGFYSLAVVRYQRDIFTCQSCGTKQILGCETAQHECKNPNCSNVFDLSSMLILPATKEELEFSDSQFDKDLTWSEVEDHMGVKTPDERRAPGGPEESKMFKEYSDVFPIKLPPGIPPRRNIPAFIPLVDGSKPHSPPLRKYSIPELRELKIQIAYYLNQGWIRPSHSPWGAPILFVPKKNGKLRFCVDYRGLNKCTVKSTYPLANIDNIIENLQGAKFFSKIDLSQGYHQVPVADEDIAKTAMKTRYGSYEWMVMNFGLTNAPAAFTHMMNDVFTDFTDIFVLVFIDDILIFSKTKELHADHVKQVLQRLRDCKLKANWEKSALFTDTVEYCGIQITPNGVSPLLDKVKSVTEWPVPTNVHDIRSFWGLVGYYRKFIPNFSKLAAPMTYLM